VYTYRVFLGDSSASLTFGGEIKKGDRDIIYMNVNMCALFVRLFSVPFVGGKQRGKGKNRYSIHE